MNDSASDIRRKLRKLEIGPVTPMENILKAAFLMFCNRDPKEEEGALKRLKHKKKGQDQPPYKSNGLEVNKRENPGGLPLVIVINAEAWALEAGMAQDGASLKTMPLMPKVQTLEKG